MMLPVARDATSYYRGAGPLGALSRKFSLLSFTQLSSWDWASMMSTKAIFMQRPFTHEHRSVFEMAKDNNKKVWLDYDDFLFDIPTDNPTYFSYMNAKVNSDVKYMIANADVVTVSTEELKTQYGQLNTNVRVVPNAISPDLFKHRKKVERKKTVLWRGSRTHHKDAFIYSPMILDICNTQYAIDWDWHFIGDNLWFLTDRMPHTRTFVTKPMDTIDYHRHIVNLGPMAMMVPLHDCVFNRAKSNIAWIEGAFAGAVTLGPDWPEWHRPGMLTYNGREQFKERLRDIVKGQVDCAHLSGMSWEYIMDNLTLDHTNQMRVKIICELLECQEKDLG